MIGVYKYIKYGIRKFSIRFSKENTKKTCAKIVTLENKFKKLEQNSDCIFDPLISFQHFLDLNQTKVNVKQLV